MLQLYEMEAQESQLTVGLHLKNITHEECHLVFHPEKESMHYSQQPRCGNNLNVPQ